MNIQTLKPRQLILPVILVLVIGVLASQVLLTPHSWERHGQDAMSAIICYNNDGPVMELENQKMNRKAGICYDQSNNAWYVVIICVITGGLITAFRRRYARCRNDVEKYLRDSGFDKYC